LTAAAASLPIAMMHAGLSNKIQRLEDVLASTPFARVMLAIGKRIIRFCEDEWKNVPSRNILESI